MADLDSNCGVYLVFFVYQPLLMMTTMIMSQESCIRQEGKGRYLTVSGMDGSYRTPPYLSKYFKLLCYILFIVHTFLLPVM